MTSFKIGETLTVQTDCIIEGMIGESVEVQKGDKAIVNAKYCIEYLTGNARGKIQRLDKNSFTIQGYDIENISKMIVEKLKYSCMLENHMENYDLEESYIEEKIAEVLDLILE